MTKHILGISGSLRASSYNTALLRAFAAAAHDTVTIDMVTADELQAIPLYNQDLESAFPATVIALKERIRAADGILIATPEYNRSVPGVLKNIIDWTSRPYGDSAWGGKPVYLVSASVGSLGGALAQRALRGVFAYLDAHVLGQPEFYLGNAADKFNSEGVLTDATTQAHIHAGLAAFETFIEQHTVKSAA